MTTTNEKRKREIQYESFENFPVYSLPLEIKRRKTDGKPNLPTNIKTRALQDLLPRNSKMKTTVSSKSLPARTPKTPGRRVSLGISSIGLPSKPVVVMTKSASTSYVSTQKTCTSPRSPPVKPFSRGDESQRSSFTAKMRRSLRIKRASPGTPFSSLRGTLKKKMQSSLRRSAMRGQQDYSISGPPVDQQYLRFLDAYAPMPKSYEDKILQERIDRELRMRDGTEKFLLAAKHPQQMLEAAKTMLATTHRVTTYMTALQKSKNDQALNQNRISDGNQHPCTAKVSLSNIRIPLMWKDVDHFKNKGDHRRYAVFCLVRIGMQIFDTSLVKDVDRNMTDICFDDELIFDDVKPDFKCTLELYCHRLLDDLTIASTPMRIKKKINDFSYNMGKRLSGMQKDESGIMSNMVVGPRFEKIANTELSLKDVDNKLNTYELTANLEGESVHNELQLFGQFCCNLAAQPDCLVNPTTVGNIYIKSPTDSEWQWYWCILKALQLNCWKKETDVGTVDPLCSIPITKDTHLSIVDPTNSDKEFSIDALVNGIHIPPIRYCLAMDTEEEQTQWWSGLQQHMLDQALWQHACNSDMKMKSFSPKSNRKSAFFKATTNLYDEMSIDSPVQNRDPLPICEMDESPINRPERSKSKTSLASSMSATSMASNSSRSTSNTNSSMQSSEMSLYDQISIDPITGDQMMHKPILTELDVNVSVDGELPPSTTASESKKPASRSNSSSGDSVSMCSVQSGSGAESSRVSNEPSCESVPCEDDIAQSVTRKDSNASMKSDTCHSLELPECQSNLVPPADDLEGRLCPHLSNNESDGSVKSENANIDISDDRVSQHSGSRPASTCSDHGCNQSDNECLPSRSRPESRSRSHSRPSSRTSNRSISSLASGGTHSAPTSTHHSRSSSCNSLNSQSDTPSLHTASHMQTTV